MDPLSFLSVENPQMNQARFSQLSGQKATLMPKWKPGKQSVGAAAVQGAVGGALAGGQLAANMGAFNNTSNPQPKATDQSVAPEQETGAIGSGGAMGDFNSPQEAAGGIAGGIPDEEYNKKFGGKNSANLMAMFLS